MTRTLGAIRYLESTVVDNDDIEGVALRYGNFYRRVPVWLGKLAAGEAGVSMFTRIRGASNAKAKRELGWQPLYPSWRDGFRRGLGDTPPPADWVR